MRLWRLGFVLLAIASCQPMPISLPGHKGVSYYFRNETSAAYRVEVGRVTDECYQIPPHSEGQIYGAQAGVNDDIPAPFFTLFAEDGDLVTSFEPEAHAVFFILDAKGDLRAVPLRFRPGSAVMDTPEAPELHGRETPPFPAACPD